MAALPLAGRLAYAPASALASASPAKLMAAGTGPSLQRQFGFFCDPSAPLVDQVAATGVGGISMGPYFSEQQSTDSNVGTLVNASESTIIGQMERARANGLRVTSKPMIDAQSYPDGGGWRAYLSPADPLAWFNDYWTRGIEPYLGASDSLIVYTELNTISAKYPDLWRGLIAKIRQAGFTGPISSDADLSTTTTPWYAALDWLGGSFYPSIDLSTDFTALRDWRTVAAQMGSAHQVTGLPIFMGEVGVAGISTAWQVRWIETMGEVLGPESWWAGLSYWRWSQDPSNVMAPETQRAFAGVAQQWSNAHPGPRLGTDPLTIKSAAVVLDCEASSLHTDVGAQVARWQDRSPSRNDLVATSTSPVVGAGFAYDREPYVRFAANSSGTLASPVALGDSYTVVVAFTKPDPYPQDMSIVDFAGPGTWQLFTSRYGVAYYYNGSFLPFASQVTNGTANPSGGGVGPHVWTIQVEGLSSVRTRLDGADLGTFTLSHPTFAPTGILIGGSTASTSPGVAAVVACAGIPSDDDLFAIETWVGSGCGLIL